MFTLILYFYFIYHGSLAATTISASTKKYNQRLFEPANTNNGSTVIISNLNKTLNNNVTTTNIDIIINNTTTTALNNKESPTVNIETKLTTTKNVKPLKNLSELCIPLLCPTFYIYQEEYANILRKKNFNSPIVCNNVTYYTSKHTYTQEDGKKLCCDAKLKMGELIRNEEMNCLVKALNKKNDFSMYLGVWDLAQTREEGRKIMTCPDLKPAITNQSLWGYKEPDFKSQFEPFGQPCIRYNACKKCKEFGFGDWYCNSKLYILCQSIKPRHMSDVLSSQPLHYKNTVYLSSKLTGSLDCNPRRFYCKNLDLNTTILYNKNIFNEIECEDKTFYISKKRHDTNIGRKLCCDSGLEVGAALDMEELECLKNDSLKLIKGSFTLFTSVWDVSFNRTFYTCPGLEKIPDNLWAKNEPNNLIDKSENCAIINICNNCTKFGYQDVICLGSHYVLCQS